MKPPNVHTRLLTRCPERTAPSGKRPLAGILLAALALALWVAALPGFTSVDVHSKTSPGPVAVISAWVTDGDATPQVGVATVTDEHGVEPAKSRSADLPSADMEGSDAERFPTRSNLPLGYRGHNWVKSAVFLADHGRVNELLRPPDA